MPSSDKNILAPRFLLQIHGEDLREDLYRYVTGIEYEMSSALADCLTIHLANPVSDKSGARLFTDSRIFLPGNPVDLWMGYGNDLVYMGRTYVGKWFPTFPRTGMPKLEIRCYDFRMKMAQHARHSGYTYRKTDAKIAEHVAVDHWGLIPMIRSASPRVRIRPHKRGGNDLQFMNRLAALNNFEFFTFHKLGEDRDRFFYGPTSDPEHPYSRLLPARDWVWGAGRESGQSQMPRYRTLLDFEPNWAVHGQTSKIVVTYFDKGKEQNVSLDVSALIDPPNHEYIGAKKYQPILSEYRHGTEVTLTAFGESQQLHTDVPLGSREDARLFAERWFLQRVNDFIIAKGAVVGEELLRPKQSHHFQNVGTRFSGGYYVTSVKHVMSGGVFESQLVCRKEVLDKPDCRTSIEGESTPDGEV